MEGGGHLQHHRAPRALGLGDLDRALHRRLVARHHDLATAVVVRGLAHFTLRRLGRHRLRRVELEAEQCRHRAGADRHGLLHRAAADAQKLRRVRHGEGSSRRQRRILAERMARDELGVALEINPGLGLEHPHHRDRHRHQRRLRVLGQRQLVGRPLPHGRGELFAERRIDLVEHRARGRKRLRQRLAHPHRLAALPRKHEGCRHDPYPSSRKKFALYGPDIGERVKPQA
jgi:hypothetical protein